MPKISIKKIMMDLKIKLSILIILISVGYIYAQQPIISYVLDRESKAPISYSNISIIGSNMGTVSDLNGQFKLKSKSLQDSIMISALGYETKIIRLGNIAKNQEILLNPAAYLIETIQLSSTSFDRELILGERNKNGRGHSFGYGSAQLGTELGTLVKIEKETLIKSVNFVLNHAKGDSLLFRVNIYNYKDGKIGTKVVKENIYLKDKQRKGHYRIDVSEYEIILTNDVLLSLEWLKDFDGMGNETITFDTKKSKSLKGTYLKYSSNSGFKRLPYKKSYKPCLYFVGKQSSN